MGLLEMFGAGGNPFYQAFDQNRGKITNAFGGMVGAGNDPRQALQGWTQGLRHGVDVDTENALIAKQEAEKQAALEAQTAKQNQTLEWLRQNAPEYASAVENGAMTAGDAWSASLAKGQPKAPIKASPGDTFLDPTTLQPISSVPAQPDPFTLGPGQVRFGADGKPVAEGPAAIKNESAPTGYRYSTAGNLEFIPGGPADPSTAGKTTEATRRNQQLAKVIVPELDSLLGNGVNPGTFDALSNPQDQMRAMGGDVALGLGQGPSPQYQQAQNSLTTIIASYLYSVSGATANPGEVANQAAVLTPKFGESAQSVAQKKARIAQMVQAVVDAATGANIPPDLGGASQTSTGVQWSIEP